MTDQENADAVITSLEALLALARSTNFKLAPDQRDAFERQVRQQVTDLLDELGLDGAGGCSLCRS